MRIEEEDAAALKGSVEGLSSGSTGMQIGGDGSIGSRVHGGGGVPISQPRGVDSRVNRGPSAGMNTGSPMPAPVAPVFATPATGTTRQQFA